MKILVAVPVFNEEKYVAQVLREIRKYVRAAARTCGVEMRVLVVNDGSTDGTAGVLEGLRRVGRVDVLTHPENRGYGQSLIDAFAWAENGGYDWVITMDCDEQHEPCRVPLFVRECLKDDVDIISGSRYLKALESADEGLPPVDRRNINRLVTELLNSTVRLKVESRGQEVGITDAFCGFKAHRVAAIRRMALTIPGYAFPMQFWVQAEALELRIRELPVKLIYKDASRHFGGMLDDPCVRLQHYLEVLTAEMALSRQGMGRRGGESCACAAILE